MPRKNFPEENPIIEEIINTCLEKGYLLPKDIDRTKHPDLKCPIHNKDMYYSKSESKYACTEEGCKHYRGSSHKKVVRNYAQDERFH